MSGQNTYTGGTTINAGTLSLAANDVLADTGALTVAGGTLAIGSFSDTVAAVAVSSGDITGTTGVLTGSSYSVTNASGTSTISARLAGSAGLTKTGNGSLSLAGANTYTGGTLINQGMLTISNNNAIPDNIITSNSAEVAMDASVRVPSLRVIGPVTIASNLSAANNMQFDNAVTIVANGAAPIVLNSTNGSIHFKDQLKAELHTYTSNPAANASPSLRVEATNGNVIFDGFVGDSNVMNDLWYASFSNQNLYELSVSARRIRINADVVTSAEQTYDGKVTIGGPTTRRTLLSVDPAVIFTDTVDAEIENLYTLIVKAVRLPNTPEPRIVFAGAVGATTAFYELQALTGTQVNPSAGGGRYGEIHTDPLLFSGTISIMKGVNTFMDQTYSGNQIIVGDQSQPGLVLFTTKKGIIEFIPGKQFNMPQSTPGITSYATKVQFKWNSGKLGPNARAAFREAGVSISTPVTQVMTAGEVLRSQNTAPQKALTGTNPTVKVGDAYIPACVEKSVDCQVK